MDHVIPHLCSTLCSPSVHGFGVLLHGRRLHAAKQPSICLQSLFRLLNVVEIHSVSLVYCVPAKKFECESLEGGSSGVLQAPVLPDGPCSRSHLPMLSRPPPPSLSLRPQSPAPWSAILREVGEIKRRRTDGVGGAGIEGVGENKA